MKRIPLTQGQFALVDDEDYEWLNQWKWCASWNPDTKSFYAMRAGRARAKQFISIRMHRQILGLKRGNKLQGDHENHDTLDNQRHNLRVVTNSQNHFNTRNTKGYYFNRSRKKYHAQIKINGRVIYLGAHDSPSEARSAYLAAKTIYHPLTCPGHLDPVVGPSSQPS
jgi:hypothetical protein